MTGPATPFDVQRWYASPRGQFFQARRLRLLERMLAAWPRRGSSLLEIGCGGGQLLDIFWQAGFDVSGAEHVPALLAAVRDRLGDRAELHLAAYDHLPFADRQFEYVAMTGCPPTPEHLAEALRVCSRGMLIVFANSVSLAGLTARLCKRSQVFPPQTPAAVSLTVLRRLRALAREGRASRLVQRSILLGPPVTWVERRPWSLLNDWPCLLPMGALHMIRLDLGPTVGMTPLVQLAKGKLSPSLRTSSCASFAGKTPSLTTRKTRF